MVSRRRKGKARKLPVTQANAYTAKLQSIVRAVWRMINEVVRAELVRVDSLPPAVAKQFGIATVRLGEIIPDEQALRAATQAGISTITQTIAAVKTSARQLTAMDDPPGVKRQLKDFATENVKLIKDLTDEQVTRARVAVTKAYESGDRASDLAKVLETELGVGLRRAQIIATDQVLTLSADVTRAMHEDAGITQYEWSTSQDERVRPSHVELEGQVFSYDNPPEPDGEAGNPGDPILCRCQALPVL